MFFNDLIQRRIAAMLRPWFRDDPELELNVGILRSNGALNNVSLNTSVLNELLEDPVRYCFKEVSVEHLTLEFSPWSSAAFVLVARGLRMVVSLGEEMDEGGVKWKRRFKDTTLEEKNNVLAEIDPEGYTLHAAIKRMAESTTKTGRRLSLSTLFEHSEIQFHDVLVLFQSQNSHDVLSCSFYVEKIKARSRTISHRCFARGLMHSLLTPSEENSVDIDISSFEIRLSDGNHKSCVMPATNFSTLVNLKLLQFRSLCLHVPKLICLFCPADLSAMLLFYALLSPESKRVRPGRLLWKILASRIRSLVPCWSMLKVVKIACLWLRYVKTYENLLLRVGYPSDDRMKGSANVMFRDTKYSRSVKSQWELISEIENDLPPEAIASARQIIRIRFSSHGLVRSVNSVERLGNRLFFWLRQVVVCVFIKICSFLRLLLLTKVLGLFSKSCKKFGNFQEHLFLEAGISLIVDEISVSVSPNDSVMRSSPGKATTVDSSSYLDLLSFQFVVDSLVMRYVTNVFEQCFVMAFGCFKVHSFPLAKSGASSKSKVAKRKIVDGMQLIWGEPAQVISFPEATNDSCGTSDPNLIRILGKVWLNWKESYAKFYQETIPNVLTPWILCELKCSMTSEGLGDFHNCFWNCGLIVGKLNFCLDNFSLATIIVLLGQIQHSLFSTVNARKHSVLHACIQNPPVRDLSSKYISYLNELELDVIRMLPRKHIQFGLLIAGPHIQLSLSDNKFFGENRDDHLLIYISLDIFNIELIITPELEDNSWFCSGKSASSDRATEFPGQEPQEIDTPKSDMELYSCEGRISLNSCLKIYGLEAHIFESAESQKQKIIVLSPTTAELKYIRKDNHSFGSTVSVLSATFRCITNGFTMLVFLDEFYKLMKVISGVFDESLAMYGSRSGIMYQKCLSIETVYSDSESGQTVCRSSSKKSHVSNITFTLQSTCVLNSFDLVLHNSRKNCKVESYSNIMPVQRETGRISATHDTSGHGIYISIYQLTTEFIFNGKDIDVITDIIGVRSIIFRDLTENERTLDKSELRSLLPCLSFLTEATISRGRVCLLFRSPGASAELDPSGSFGGAIPMSGDGAVRMCGDFPLVVNTDSFKNQYLCANITLSGIYMVESQVKDILVNEHKLEEISAEFAVQGAFQSISWKSKGGSLLLEALAVVMFIKCCTSYCNCILEILSTCHPSGEVVSQHIRDMNSANTQFSIKPQQVQLQQFIWDHLEMVSLFVSHVSLILVARDESGRLQELLFEVDFQLNLELLNVRKISIAISKLSILSQFMHGGMENKSKVTRSHRFSSVSSDDSCSNFNSMDCSPWHKKTIQSGHGNASGSSPSSSRKGACVDSFVSNLSQESLKLSPQNSILKNLQCFLAVEEPKLEDENSPAFFSNIWVGYGSVSGFDMTISLSEINIILSASESFSAALMRKGTSKVESEQSSDHPEPEGTMEEMIPDGAIVAIKDSEQHMYIAVEGSESKYDVTGAIHYSLVGKRALFRVKHHHSGPWKSKVQYFSLISLYAKNDSGESLRLNSNPRSRFVSISCSNDNGSALWRMCSFKDDEPYQDAFVVEASSPLDKQRTFHFLNKKNDCAVAFIDGTFEFVNNPGSLFKWKVFGDPGPGNNLLPQNCVLNSFETTLQSESNEINEEGSSRKRNPLWITITFDKVILTLVHELSDAEEKFPLLQGSITPSETIIQISKSKYRVMNMLTIALCYFDAQQNLWMECVQPLDFCSFYHSKFHVQGSENILHGVPNHFYVKMTEVNVSFNELSLDILLYVIGKLDIAGPYAIKSSLISTNCCKVQNQSGLTILCQFYNNEVSISARQSNTVFSRHLTLTNQPPEASYFSLQLVNQGFLSTSPIRLSLLESRKFSWRTRIISSRDSKSYPGPIIVTEITRGIKDSLSIVVSPLFRLHNETDFLLELRFQRPEHKETESANVMLKSGDTIDDFMTAFSALDFSGGSRKALTSLSVGNFIFSFRPNIVDSSKNCNQPSVEWSDDLKGGKPIRLSRVFDKLSYKVRKAFSVDSSKSSLKSANCVLKSEDDLIANIHFLILTIGKGIPVINPNNIESPRGNKDSPVALQEQKEIFLLPTVRVSNYLYTEIHVNLTDRDSDVGMDHDNVWSNATIPCESSVNFYANPETIYFIVTLTSLNSKSKPVNSSDWVRKLLKQKSDIPHLDIELDFGSGKYFATLRLSRGYRGTLEVAIMTTYALQNDTNSPLFCFAANKKSVSSEYAKRFGSNVPPELGSCLPPKSITSWFLKCHKLHLRLSEENALDAMLDVDALSGLTEIDLESDDIYGLKNITRFGVSLLPSISKQVPSQIVSLSSRYVVCNDSEEVIAIRQCYMEGMEDLIAINSKQRIALKLKKVTGNKREINVIENLLRKHTKSQVELSLFVQFRLNETGLSWSGPICVASLGRFFVRFRKSPESVNDQLNHLSNKEILSEFAAVYIVEEGSTIVLHFRWPPDKNLPYRIENCLRDVPISYYQKGSSEPENLGAGVSVSYVWDDPNLPHKLVVQLDDVHLLREINLDKVRSWKPLYRNKQTGGLGFRIPLERKIEDRKRDDSQLLGTETLKVGYEVYAEGVTRVLRICCFSDSHKMDLVAGSRTKIQLRISYFAVHVLENTKQEIGPSELFNEASIIVARFERISWNSMFTTLRKYNHIRIHSLSLDEKWVGAPFAAMLRRHQSETSDANDCILCVAIVLVPSISGVKQVKYLSIVLQPFNLNLDEETLMKLVPFWRSSLSDSNAPRQQYYFDHFEIHPIKIVASFLPGDLYYNYNSTQETLRSLLHSVIKMPAIQSKTVELNGVLVTHALITLRELTIKCVQHYSWYSMRAIYIAKGSPLLPPAFASIFDDLASSSLDVFFDPSSSLLNLPGVTLGTLKLISKFIHNKGFSGTKRYFGDLGKTLKTAGSNILFAAVTEVSDSVLKGAETSGLNGMVGGFHKGILKLAMEPSVLSNAFMEGGPDRKIKLDRSPGIDELYIEGYLQAMLDTMYKQEYLRVKVIENQVVLKNLPPSSTLINEIMDSVKSFLASKALLKGETSAPASLRYMRGEREWRIGPTLLTLCEHLFVSFAIRFLRKQTGKVVGHIKHTETAKEDEEKAVVPAKGGMEKQKVKLVWKWGIGKFVLSGIVAYMDGRLCRNIPNPLARRIVSGFLLSFLDRSEDESQ